MLADTRADGAPAENDQEEEEWRPQQARAWPHLRHPLLELRSLRPQGQGHQAFPGESLVMWLGFHAHHTCCSQAGTSSCGRDADTATRKMQLDVMVLWSHAGQEDFGAGETIENDEKVAARAMGEMEGSNEGVWSKVDRQRGPLEFLRPFGSSHLLGLAAQYPRMNCSYIGLGGMKAKLASAWDDDGPASRTGGGEGACRAAAAPPPSKVTAAVEPRIMISAGAMILLPGELLCRVWPAVKRLTGTRRIVICTSKAALTHPPFLYPGSQHGRGGLPARHEGCVGLRQLHAAQALHEDAVLLLVR